MIGCVKYFTSAPVTHQLSCQQGHVLYNCQADPPLCVLCQLHDGWQKRLGELADAYHLVHTVQVGDYVETHLGALEKMTNDCYD